MQFIAHKRKLPLAFANPLEAAIPSKEKGGGTHIYGNTLNNFHQNRPVPNNIYFSRPALLSQYMSYYGKRSAEALPAAEAEAEADAYYPYYYNWNLVNRNNWNMYGNTMNNVYQRPVTSNRISNRPSMLLQYTNYYGKRSDEQIGHE